MLVAAFGDTAIYLMINPTKASYSMAPTMMVCALAGFLTAKLFAEARRKLVLIALIGLLIGLAVNFRLANLFLASGYWLFFWLVPAFAKPGDVSAGACIRDGFLVGVAPTLLANAINAGSPFSTTYGDVDVTPPELNPACYGPISGMCSSSCSSLLWLDSLDMALAPAQRHDPGRHRAGAKSAW